MMNPSVASRPSNIKDFVHGSRPLKPGEAVPDRLSWIALLGRGEMLRARKSESAEAEVDAPTVDDVDPDLLEFED